ncbi:MATE family efflux transporter [Acidisoma cellulosilytica]|uniref:MATE family efflux transporter n=1 Tax=Acidisoma cellulosilyticum TaxID=2802395 RepID=A0A963YY54_9PROT|nr:MATE family efflux transporter [Acidisoma cellulosilyticum]MCB8878981.1 MATE family efflux transporter [Acidisoma cellulosilyticum]
MTTDILRAPKARPFAREVGTLVLLALPLILGQLFGIGTDVILSMVGGHMGATVMASVALGSSLWIVVFMAVIGLMMSSQPAISRLHGAGREHEAGHVFAQALLLGLGFGTLGGIVLAVAGPLFATLMHLPPAVLPGISAFLHGAAFSVPALGIVAACRGLSEGLSMTRPTMLVGGAGLAFLVPAAWLLMEGAHLPGLGFVGGYGPMGAGIAISFVLAMEALFYLLWVGLSGRYPMVEWTAEAFRIDPAVISRLIRVGAPIAVAIVMEVCMFSVATLMVGQFGAVAVAGHQVALMTSAVFFMVPLGLSLAVTVRVGRAVGARDKPAILRAGLAGFIVMLCTQTCSGLCMELLPHAITGAFTDIPAVAALGASLLVLAGFFQFADGTQAVAMAALRGLEDTRVPMLLAVLAYWLCGIPLGAAFAFGLHMGVRGVWFGLMSGLTLAALMLTLRFFWKTGALSRR